MVGGVTLPIIPLSLLNYNIFDLTLTEKIFVFKNHNCLRYNMSSIDFLIFTRFCDNYT